MLQQTSDATNGFLQNIIIVYLNQSYYNKKVVKKRDKLIQIQQRKPKHKNRYKFKM